MKRFDAQELLAFLFGRTLHAFDPDSCKRVATVRYGLDGICGVTFVDGTQDQGCYGLEDDTYWTRYDKFRAGETHCFYLVQVAPHIAQAYHADGQRAFLQSALPELKSLRS